MSLAPTFRAPMTSPTELHGLQKPVKRPEQPEKDQRADQIARGLARLVEPRGDAVEQRLQRGRRQAHPAALAAAQHARHRREQPRRRPGRRGQVAVGQPLAKIVDPGARRFEQDDLAENVGDAGDQQPEDDAVECRVAQKRVQQGRSEDDAIATTMARNSAIRSTNRCGPRMLRRSVRRSVRPRAGRPAGGAGNSGTATTAPSHCAVSRPAAPRRAATVAAPPGRAGARLPVGRNVHRGFTPDGARGLNRQAVEPRKLPGTPKPTR